MTDFEKELIYYIFHVQDADDDNLSAEVICRKLYKHGLINRENRCWRPKLNYKYRFPARVHKREQKEQYVYKSDRKTEPLKTADYCDICKQDMCKDCIADATNPYCVPSHYEIKQTEPTGYNLSPVEDEPQTERSER